MKKVPQLGPQHFRWPRALHDSGKAVDHGVFQRHTKVFELNSKKHVVDWTSDETGKGSEGSSKADLITKTLYCPAAEAGYKTLGADKKTAPESGAVNAEAIPITRPCLHHLWCGCGNTTGIYADVVWLKDS